MEIASNYEIAIANLACALASDTVSEEHRVAIKASATSVERIIGTLNLFIVSYSNKLLQNSISTEKAAKSVSAEYRACGLSELLNYSVFKPAVEMFFQNKAGSLTDIAAKIAAVSEISAAASECTEERVRDAMQIYVLRLLNNFGLVTYDIPLTRKIMESINTITEERKERAIMPPVLLSEL